MSATSIQFIGLFVVMMNSGAGLHIILPHFPETVFANHVSVIQFDPNQVKSISWPGVISCGPNGSLQCAPVDLETITFSGAIDPAPVDVIGNISHLRCCCASMTDILAKYKDPAASGKLSAHIFVDRGVAQALPDPNGRTDTWVTMHSTSSTGITLRASSGSTSLNIVFNAGAQFQILNTILDSTSPSPTVPPHFLAYYLMGVGSSSCTSLPTDGPPCAPRATECVAPKVKQSASIRRGAATQSNKTIHATTLETDPNCSNSHWP